MLTPYAQAVFERDKAEAEMHALTVKLKKLNELVDKYYHQQYARSKRA